MIYKHFERKKRHPPKKIPLRGWRAGGEPPPDPPTSLGAACGKHSTNQTPENRRHQLCPQPTHNTKGPPKADPTPRKPPLLLPRTWSQNQNTALCAVETGQPNLAGLLKFTTQTHFLLLHYRKHRGPILTKATLFQYLFSPCRARDGPFAMPAHSNFAI